MVLQEKQIFFCREVTLNKEWANKPIIYYANPDIDFLWVLSSSQVLDMRICTGPISNGLMKRKLFLNGNGKCRVQTENSEN